MYNGFQGEKEEHIAIDRVWRTSFVDMTFIVSLAHPVNEVVSAGNTGQSSKLI